MSFVAWDHFIVYDYSLLTLMSSVLTLNLFVYRTKALRWEGKLLSAASFCTSARRERNFLKIVRYYRKNQDALCFKAMGFPGTKCTPDSQKFKSTEPSGDSSLQVEYLVLRCVFESTNEQHLQQSESSLLCPPGRKSFQFYVVPQPSASKCLVCSLVN